MTLHIIGLVGSLRAASFNRVVFDAARDLLDAGAPAPTLGDAVLLEASLADVPLYNGDVEDAGDPPAVVALKSDVRRADGVLIFTPEYNGSVPGVTKNAIDWLSRPYGAGPIIGAPVGVVVATPGRHGGTRAQAHIESTLGVLTDGVFLPSLGLASVSRKLDAEGRLDDVGSAELTSWLDGFIQHVRTLRTPTDPDG